MFDTLNLKYVCTIGSIQIFNLDEGRPLVCLEISNDHLHWITRHLELAQRVIQYNGCCLYVLVPLTYRLFLEVHLLFFGPPILGMSF